MAQLDKPFDSGQYDDMTDGFEPMPKGEYLSKITKSEVKETKTKTGKYIKFEFIVMNGEFKGRKFWANINIVNPNPVAVEIAQKELATLCRACGKGAIQDTQELHEIPIMVKLKVKPEQGDYPAGNEPIGYYAAGKAGATKVTKEQTGSEDTGEPESDDVPWGE